MRASVTEAVAEAEGRLRVERDEAVARATSEAEQRLRDDADAALRLAQEAFESRLAATAAAPAAGLPRSHALGSTARRPRRRT